MKRVLAIFLSLLLMLPLSLSVMPTLAVTADIEGRVVRDINLKGNITKTLSGNSYVCGPATTFPATDLTTDARCNLQKAAGIIDKFPAETK